MNIQVELTEKDFSFDIGFSGETDFNICFSKSFSPSGVTPYSGSYEAIPRVTAQSLPTQDRCKGCGKPITRVPQHRQRQFCSDSCRMTYWNSHRDQVRHKLNYPKQCPCCGNEFEIRGNPNRKYCSRSCADRAKRKGPVADGR